MSEENLIHDEEPITKNEDSKQHRRKYLNKRIVYETEEARTERLQKAREDWTRRWNNMTEEERNRHRTRTRDRYRRIKASRLNEENFGQFNNDNQHQVIKSDLNGDNV